MRECVCAIRCSKANLALCPLDHLQSDIGNLHPSLDPNPVTDLLPSPSPSLTLTLTLVLILVRDGEGDRQRGHGRSAAGCVQVATALRSCPQCCPFLSIICVHTLLAHALPMHAPHASPCMPCIPIHALHASPFMLSMHPRSCHASPFMLPMLPCVNGLSVCRVCAERVVWHML